MCRVERRTTIAADPEGVWSLVADLDREPEFWKGTRAVRTLSTQGNVVEREVTIAFRESRQQERVTLERPTRVRHEILSGPMRGTKEITLAPTSGGTELRVVWDVRLRGFMKLGARVVERHIGEGTEHGLERLRAAAEGRPIPP